MDPKEVEEFLMEQQRNIEAATFLEHAYLDGFSCGGGGPGVVAPPQPLHLWPQQVFRDACPMNCLSVCLHENAVIARN